MKKFFGLLIVILITSCTNIQDLTKSQKLDDIFKANELIASNQDTTYVCFLFSDIYSIRSYTGNKIWKKGRTVYYSKVMALIEISHLQPPKNIDYEPDTIVINFYKQWARSKGYKCDCLN